MANLDDSDFEDIGGVNNDSFEENADDTDDTEERNDEGQGNINGSKVRGKDIDWK